MEIPSYLVYQGQPQFIELLTQTLQFGVSENGFVIPSKSTDDITALANMLPGLVPAGTMWFDTTLKKLVVMTAAPVAPATPAVLEVITSVAI